MKEAYSFLKDPRALAEIRKHKWLESQKAGREIGFATAAVDWVKNYGEQWKKIHAQEYKDNGLFLERRRYRRFKVDCMVELKETNALFSAEAVNISFFGLLFRAADYVYPGSEVNVHLLCEQNDAYALNCKGTIERAFPVAPQRYELFLRFDNRSQEGLEGWEYLKKKSIEQ